MRLLTIDIGNTTVHWAVFIKDKIRENGRVKTREFKRLFKELPNFDEAIFSSVVPSVNKTVETELHRLSGHKPLELTWKESLGVKMRYYEPTQLGADRLANIIFVVKSVKNNCIVIDVGTAITIDVIRGDEFLGGVILPSYSLSLKALKSETANIKLNGLAESDTVIGKNTLECVSIGILKGIDGGIKSLIESIKDEPGLKDLRIYITGGEGKRLAKIFKNAIYDPYITLKGLRESYKILA